MSLPAVSKHLKVLEQAGLISRSRQAQLRPCHLEAELLGDAAAWLQNYQQLWEARLDGLNRYLQEVQSGSGETIKSKDKE